MRKMTGVDASAFEIPVALDLVVRGQLGADVLTHLVKQSRLMLDVLLPRRLVELVGMKLVRYVRVPRP